MNLSSLPLRELREMTAERETLIQDLRAERLEIAQEIERRTERGEDEDEPPSRRKRWWHRADPDAPAGPAQTVAPGFIESESDVRSPGGE